MLHVNLLGEQAISGADGTVRTRSSRTLTLVAFLALHAGIPQGRQRIAALFWPDSSDEQALTNLRRELHHLRGALAGDESLVVTGKDLCWVDLPTCEVDVRAFRRDRATALTAVAAGEDEAVLARTAAAVDHYRGEFLPGSYEDWVLDVRSELEQECVNMLDLLVDVRARTADLTGAVDASRRRVQLRPLEEVGHRKLIELYGALGDRAGAVSAYHHCASILERELGLEPDPATREALNRLLARAGPAVATAPTPAPARSGRGSTRLVGRTDEFAQMHDLWQAAAAGRPGLVVVCGDAGVGKTRLVTEITDVARRGGAVVASARCFGTSGQLALSPVADWLRAPPVRAAVGGLDPIWRAEVDRLVPSTEARTEPGLGPRAMVDAWQHHRFFEGLSRALLGVGRPLLLAVDNLHWCDQETLAFITFCLGLTHDAPLFVTATMRDGFSDREPELDTWLGRMRATGLLTELTLGPLGVSDTALLAGGVTGTPMSTDDAEVLHAATGGFPLYIVEAARSIDDAAGGSVPIGDLAAVLRKRLGQASDAARDVAGLAAAVGRNFTLDLITEASDLDADTVVQAVDELWRRRILREVGDGYDFSHDLLREMAYAQVSSPTRWLLHRRVAQSLELLHAEDCDPISAQLAEQYARGGRGDRAVRFYQRAAEVAASRFAHAEAIRLHDDALSIVQAMPEGPDRSGQELRLLEATAAPLNARYGYASPRLRQTLERAIALADGLGRRESLLNGLVGLWASQFVRGDGASAYRTAARALTLVNPRAQRSGAAHFAFGGSALSRGRPAEALHHLELAAQLAGAGSLPIGTRPDIHAAAFTAHAQWLLGDADAAAASCADAIALARTDESPYSLAVALAYGSITHQLRGDLDTLRWTVAELRELCDRYGFAYYREWGAILDGWSRTDGSGLVLAQRGVDRLADQDSFARMPYWLSLVADLSAREGRPDAARATLDAAVAGARARDDVWWLPEVLRMRAGYDDRNAAVAQLQAAAELAAEHGSVALLRRCESDLAFLGVFLRRSVFPADAEPMPDWPNGSRTLRS